jgi:hypothetical protein
MWKDRTVHLVKVPRAFSRISLPNLLKEQVLQIYLGAPLAVFAEMCSARTEPKNSKTFGSGYVTDNANNDHRKCLQDGSRFENFLLVGLCKKMV